MKTDQLKDGPVTYQQSERMVALAEKWLVEYFSDGEPRRPGDLEDDFAGRPGIDEIIQRVIGRWRSTPFFPALGRLVDKGIIEWEKADDGVIWYAIAGALPIRNRMITNDMNMERRTNV